MTVPPPPGAPGAVPPPQPPYPATKVSKVSVTWTGILLALGAVVAVVGTFLQFEKLSGDGGSYAFTGIGSETVTGNVDADFFTPGGAGKTILVLGVVALVLGLLIVAKQGRLWVSIVSLVASAIGLILGFAAIGAASGDADKLSTQAGGADITGSVGIGAVLATVGMAVAVIASIIALAVRRPRT